MGGNLSKTPSVSDQLDRASLPTPGQVEEVENDSLEAGSCRTMKTANENSDNLALQDPLVKLSTLSTGRM